MAFTNKINKIALYFGAVFSLHVATATHAMAGIIPRPARPTEFGGPGSGNGTTLGDTISNVIFSLHSTPGLLSGFSYLMGIFFGFWGIWKLMEHVNNPSNPTIWEPMKRFAAGGAFFALPTVISASYNTVARGIRSARYSEFNSEGASSLGLDGMLVKLISDVWMPMHGIVFAFCYLAGIFLIMIGISRLLKSEQDGPRGPASLGTMMTFLVGGALLSADKMLGASLASVFDTTVSSSNGVLVYQTGMGQTELAHAHAVIAAIVAFVAIIGWISFIRGLFILRGVSEGNSQASMMAAVTHIIGGAIAVNLGGFIMAVQNTLGITGQGVGITFS